MTKNLAFVLLFLSICGLGTRLFYVQKHLDESRASMGKCIKVGWECAHMLRACYNNKSNLIDAELQ